MSTPPEEQPVIIINEKKYDSSDLRSDNLTNTYWNLPNEDTLKELKKRKISTIKKTRQLYEISKPDLQCTSVVGPARKQGKCYICDIVMKNLEDAGFGSGGFVNTGRQCEHVIPVLIMAIICGLKSSKNGNYEKKVFNKYKKFKPFMKNYLEWRNNVWNKGYLWSHTECNMIKNENPFIKINVDLNSKIPISCAEATSGPGKPNINIIKLFKQLLQKTGQGSKWCGMWRRHYGKTAIDEINSAHEEDTDDWMQKKLLNLHEKYLDPLINVIQKGGEGGEDTPKEYFMISILILRETIIDRLFEKPSASKIKKVFDTGDRIMRLFQSAGAGQGGGGLEEEVIELVKQKKIKKMGELGKWDEIGDSLLGMLKLEDAVESNDESVNKNIIEELF